MGSESAYKRIEELENMLAETRDRNARLGGENWEKDKRTEELERRLQIFRGYMTRAEWKLFAGENRAHGWFDEDGVPR